MMGFWFFTTQYLQNVKGFSPLAAGVAFFPMTIVNFVVAIAVPRLTRRLGNRLLLASGLAITMIGMFWLRRLSADTSYLTGVALPMILIGARHLFAHRVAVSLTVDTGMLAFAFVLVVALIVRVRRTADIASHPPVSQAASHT
jgi:Na+/melibiose symporter-like transporter